jgi:hypothetical protein
VLHYFSQEKILDPPAMSSHAVMQSGFPSYAQILNDDNGISYNGKVALFLIHKLGWF